MFSKKLLSTKINYLSLNRGPLNNISFGNYYIKLKKISKLFFFKFLLLYYIHFRKKKYA